MSEAAIVNRIRNLLQKRGAWNIKTTGVAVVGTPDILACYRGHFLALEVKTPRGTVRPTQAHQLDRVQQAGGHAIVARHPDQVAELLDQIDRQDQRP